MLGKPLSPAIILSLLPLLALAPLPASGQPQARAWLIVEDYGNGTITPSLYMTGLAPPGALTIDASIEANNTTATLIVRAQSPLLATVLEQKGIKSLALTLEVYKQANATTAQGRGRLDAATSSENITIGLIQAELSRTDENTMLRVVLGDIEGGATPESIADTLNKTLGTLPMGPGVTVRPGNGTVTIELALPQGLAALLGRELEWNATLILIASGGMASLSLNASLGGDLRSLTQLLAPEGAGYKPAMPARATAETLSNGTLLVRLPNMRLEGASPGEVAASIASYAGELLGGNVTYTVKSASPATETGQRTGAPSTMQPPASHPAGGERGDRALVAISGVIVAVVLLLLLARVRR